MGDEQLRILLVDDSEADREAYRRLLARDPERREYEVVEASSGEEGLAAMRSAVPDCVLLDYSMPEMDGVEFLGRLGAADMPDVPVIMITGHADEALALEVVAQGAQDYLLKGKFDAALLGRSIRHAIERHRALKQAREYARRARASARNFRNLLARSPDGMLVLGEQRRILFCNPMAERLLGRAQGELRGRGFELRFSPGKVVEAELRIGDRCLSVELRAGGVEWEARQATLVSLRDITYRKRNEELIRDSARRIEELQTRQLELKDRFISHVSHELRTPLNAIHQFASILSDGIAGELEEDQTRYLEIVLRNTRQLRKMIDDLLDLTRSTTGKLDVDPQPMQLEELAEEVLGGFEAGARTGEVALEFVVDPELPAAFADPARVRQVLANLLDNAIKFTPCGGRVAVHIGPAGAAPGMLSVEVRDSGPGLAAEDGERIFEYLYQGVHDAGTSRKGFGIGLYLCRELVASQGGRIWVESEEGSGATFTFTLPVASPERIGSRT